MAALKGKNGDGQGERAGCKMEDGLERSDGGVCEGGLERLV